MGSVNVNRSITDAFYRYKMPRICVKVEGKGNGIKTIIVNMVEIAKALGRPPTYATKYFGYELGAQTQIDPKNDRFTVNGSHESAKLQDLLDGFITKYVLCPACHNPETELLVSTKRNTISQGCKACGHHDQLDFNHKLNTFILKNPSQAYNKQADCLTKVNSKRSKRSGSSSGNDSKQNRDTSNVLEEKSNMGCNGSGNVAKTSYSRTDKEVAASDDEEYKWTIDISEEAVRTRMENLTERAKSMTLTEVSKSDKKESVDMFHAFLKERLRNNLVQGAENVSEIVQEAEKLEVKDYAALVAMEVLVHEGSLAADVRAHRALLVRLTGLQARAQRHALYAVDALCRHSPTALAKVPALLKLLYDLDIVGEKSIIEWASKPSSKYAPKKIAAEVRKRAAPFLEWLVAPETDSQNDEDELEIEYSDRLATTSTRDILPPEDGSDLDIDAI